MSETPLEPPGDEPVVTNFDPEKSGQWPIAKPDKSKYSIKPPTKEEEKVQTVPIASQQTDAPKLFNPAEMQNPDQAAAAAREYAARNLPVKGVSASEGPSQNAQTETPHGLRGLFQRLRK